MNPVVMFLLLTSYRINVSFPDRYAIRTSLCENLLERHVSIIN